MYKIARNSTVRMIVDTMEPFGSGFGYYEWDAHADNMKLPELDLVGLVGFSCTENDTFHDLTFGIAVMTFDDPGLSRSTDYVDAFYRRLKAQSRFIMFDHNGLNTGFEAIVFDGTSVSPMGRVDARPTVEIEVTARVTLAGQPLD